MDENNKNTGKKPEKTKTNTVVWIACFVIAVIVIAVIEAEGNVKLGMIPVLLITTIAGGVAKLISKAMH